jgi:hypothetical protein
MATTKRLVLTAAGTQNIEPDLVGSRVEVLALCFGISAATALPDFRSHTSGTVHAGPFDNAAPITMGSPDHSEPLFKTDVDNGLDMVTAGAGNVRGFIVYRVVPK